MRRLLGPRLGCWIGAFALCFTGVCCSKPAEGNWPDRPGPKVMTLFAPIYCFAANVAGDDASVQCLMGEKGPHNFVVSPQDAMRLHKADILFAVGIDLDEKIAENLRKNCGNKQLQLEFLGEAGCMKGKLLKMDLGPAHAGHGHGEYDPHVWLGIPEAICMVETIRNVLIENDAKNKARYEERATSYIARLKKLETDGLAMLEKKQDRNLITFHESLQYFAASFKLKIVGAIEPMPGTEPDSNRIAKLVQLCKAKNVRVITTEPQYPSSAAQLLLRELKANGLPDAEVVEIDPIETVSPKALTPSFYEDKMRQNLANLAAKLK